MLTYADFFNIAACFQLSSSNIEKTFPDFFKHCSLFSAFWRSQSYGCSLPSPKTSVMQGSSRVMEAAVRSESPVLASDVLASDIEEVLTEVIEQLVREGGEKDKISVVWL
jgi:hypothetical protein